MQVSGQDIKYVIHNVCNTLNIYYIFLGGDGSWKLLVYVAI